ncbi:MAG TPA: TadE/TadG family type IV pilus assembly protein [Aestuariivirgaceae bacterium]|nr:TadE/TadG family type IV pilus assembly protein [Aestuariivirgaceae bacterium]
MRQLHRLRHCQSGAAALEFAIVSLFLVLVSIGVVDFGRGFHVRNNMSYAADVGARTLLTNPETSDSTLEGAIRDAFTGPEPELLVVDFLTEMVGGTTYRTVTITYPLDLHIPGFESSPIDLTVTRRIPLT